MKLHSSLWIQLCLLLDLAISRSMLSNKSETHFKGLYWNVHLCVCMWLVCMCTSRPQQIYLLQGTVDINLKFSVQTPQSGHLFGLQSVQTHNPVRLDKNRKPNIAHSPFQTSHHLNNVCNMTLNDGTVQAVFKYVWET